MSERINVAQSVIQEIDAYMKKSGIEIAGWYVGITADIEERLFGFHKVPRMNHPYIYLSAPNSVIARIIEAAYHNAGCQGAGGGGDDTAVLVYAYAITEETVEKQ